MNQNRTPDKRRLAQEVEARFGLMPNFFCTATSAPGLIDELWTFAKAAYLDSPLPSLFKERLFVYLSRFCAVRYCIVRHVGFLIGEGRPAGDASAPPETIAQVIALLTRPAPCARALEQALARLEALTGPTNIPIPRTQLESDLFDALTIIFLEPHLSERARNAVQWAFGNQSFETLAAYLAFIRTAHYWTETHPELAYEPDIAAVMQRHPDLTALLLDQTEANGVAEGAALRQALAERNAQLSLAGKAGLVGTYAYDVDTEIMQISEGYVAIHGFPEGTAEIARSKCLASVHSEDIERVRQRRDEAFNKGSPEYSVEYRIIRPNGEIRWVETRCFISYESKGGPQRVIGVSIDITERKRGEEQQRALHAELDHRVKNVLATVSAVVSHTRQGSRSVASFAAALEGRISSMAKTHELLSSDRWMGVSLTKLVDCELAAYAAGNNTRVNGPKVTLLPEVGQAMAIVLHELVTNAAKHGALSTRNGRVSIQWDRRHDGKSGAQPLVFEWQEIGGPPVAPSGKRGYGTTTIRDLIPYEFGGTVDLVFAPDGVRCRLELPADWLSYDGAI
jgi:PAS domain S-box-containing protein